MKFLYCDNVFDQKTVDPAYESEMIAAKNLGFEAAVFSFEALQEGNLNKAFKNIQISNSKEMGIYRGWMLNPEEYALMYTHLLAKNIELINTPEQYQHCHYLPHSYSIIEKNTPRSVWTEGQEHLNSETVNALAQTFGNSPIILKDYVKSEKHNWEDACFIPDASDSLKVATVVSKFLELRGDSLNQGIVFRQFEALEFLTQHSQSGMPLTLEYRLFFLNGRLLKQYNYWDEGDYSEETIDLSEFKAIAKNIQSNFFTMDIAKKTDGTWIIVELGDGQVAGLPDNAERSSFYQLFKEIED